MFIFINRVKQQCQHGMRLRQKPQPVSYIGGDALQRKSGLFGSNIAQVKTIIVIEMCCLQSLCTKKMFNLSCSTHYTERDNDLSSNVTACCVLRCEKYQPTTSCTAPSIALFSHIIALDLPPSVK